MTDGKTGTSYFDCPGFEDTRGSCIEVSTTYYMKDIVRHARQIKVPDRGACCSQHAQDQKP